MALGDASERIRRWKKGRASVGPNGVVLAPRATNLGKKLRAAYDWLSTQALVCPFADIEYGEQVVLGPAGTEVRCQRGEAFSSYVLFPLLNLAVGQRLLFVGAPGRGKTTVATLMGLLAGGSRSEVRRATQHGHPQLTIADLLGALCPAS